MQEKEKQVNEEEKTKPHFSNLNEDPALSGKLRFILHEGSHQIGNGKDGPTPTIVLNGPRWVQAFQTVMVLFDVSVNPVQLCTEMWRQTNDHGFIKKAVLTWQYIFS